MAWRWDRVLLLSLACLVGTGLLSPGVASEPETQNYLGPGTYIFPGHAEATRITVEDDVWGPYACFGVERDGDDLHVTIGIVVVCIDDNLEVAGPATRGTITVS